MSSGRDRPRLLADHTAAYCNPSSLGHSRTQQSPAPTAPGAPTTHKALRNGNPDPIRPFIRAELVQGIDDSGQPKGPKGDFASTYIDVDQDDADARHVVFHGQVLTDASVLSVGLSDLQQRILGKLDLDMTFGQNFEHPHKLGNLYRPVPTLMPANLLGAAWLQFCLYVADLDREWRLCVMCGRPFELTRSDRMTCSGACQKKRRRRL